MSIRIKILLPLLAFLALGIGLAGIVGLRSLSAFSALAAMSDKTIDANAASRGARDRFEAGEQILARVLAMTDLVEPLVIQTGFKEAAAGLSSQLVRLETAALSERMSGLAKEAAAEAARWQADAEILLGLRSASEIPTVERMARHSLALRRHLDGAVVLAGDDAHTQTAEAGASLRAQIWTMLGVGAVMAAVGIAVAVWLAGNLSGPLMRLVKDASRLAAGDLSVRLAGAERRDEVGAMVAAVQVFKDNMIGARQLEDETVLARAGAEAQRKAAMREMADGFERAVGTIIGTVTSSAVALRSTAHDMTTIATRTVDRSDTVAAAAHESADNVNAVAAAAEQLGSSVQEIGRQVDGSAELARAAVAEAAQSAALVQELSTAASRIGDVVRMISDIAGQTNLLALNATIEAARAGESGRGFAVVAAEVKALASQTGKATDEIGGQIARIQDATAGSVQAIDRIAERIRNISNVATSIAAAVEQQGAATQEIARNVSHAAAGANRVNVTIADVTGAAQATGSAASQVLGSATELSRQSDSLNAEVARFLATVRAA